MAADLRTTAAERAEWTAGRKSGPIYLLRTRTGLDLLDAKELLELETGVLLNPPRERRLINCPTCGGSGKVRDG